MGIIAHHAIVVTSWKDDLIEQAHAKAASFGCLVSPVSDEGVNGYRSFCVFPDGSKEGWEASHEGDSARDALDRWMREQAYDDGSNALSWVEIHYGEISADGDDRARIVRHGYASRKDATPHSTAEGT